MKYFIFDSSNDGVVWMGNQLSIADRLCHGLLDCEISMVWPNSKSYQVLTTANGANLHWNYATKQMLPLPESAINSLFVEKKRLAGIRHPAMSKLFVLGSHMIRKIYTTTVPTIENDLSFALDNSDPSKDQYDYSVTEYAQITGITDRDAYKELTLYVENMRTQKIRTFSYTEYFSKKINSATTQEEIAIIIEDIEKKFITDSQI